MQKGQDWFTRFASTAAHWAGQPLAFAAAFIVVLLWAIAGPFAGFSEPWQLTINTGTTIITFLMVFIIQSSQNRDTAAIQVKLDELIRAVQGADNALLDLEEMTEEELERFRAKYEALARRSRETGDPNCE